MTEIKQFVSSANGMTKQSDFAGSLAACKILGGDPSFDC